MLVKQLIELLQEENPNDLVVLSIDEEGNGFNEAYQIERARYSKENWDIKHRELTPELVEQGYEEDDIYTEEQGVDCIVIWP